MWSSVRTNTLQTARLRIVAAWRSSEGFPVYQEEGRTLAFGISCSVLGLHSPATAAHWLRAGHTRRGGRFVAISVSGRRGHRCCRKVTASSPAFFNTKWDVWSPYAVSDTGPASVGSNLSSWAKWRYFRRLQQRTLPPAQRFSDSPLRASACGRGWFGRAPPFSPPPYVVASPGFRC